MVSDRNNVAAEAFLAELDRAVELISESPLRWPIHLHGNGTRGLGRGVGPAQGIDSAIKDCTNSVAWRLSARFSALKWAL